MSSQPSYKIYPSLLDKFQRMLDTTAEDYLYLSESDGKYHRNYNESTSEFVYSQEEVDEFLKQDVIDAINRVPFASEAADKGTAFNDIIDTLIGNGSCKSNVMFQDFYEVEHATGSVDLETQKPDAYDSYVERVDRKCIIAEVGEKKFFFDYDFCKEAAPYFQGSLSQVFVSAPVETKYGIVELYGYIDELVRDKVYDIKTTSAYQFGKYKKGWQRHVYPYCLIESGKATNISSFEFSAFVLRKLSGTPLITGTMYPEVYTYNHAYSSEEIKVFLERFIEFLEMNRQLITDKKIFNGSNT